MKHYLDIKKAITTMPNVGVDTPKEEQSTTEHKASYAKRPVGVAEGESYEPGKASKEDDENSVDSEVKATQKQRSATAKEESKASKDTAKSLEILAKMITGLEETFRLPTALEQEFLRDVLGSSQAEINKGLIQITHRTRRLFDRWLCDRLVNSTMDLKKSIGV